MTTANKIIAYHRRGMGIKSIAHTLKLRHSVVRRAVQQFKQSRPSFMNPYLEGIAEKP